MTEALLDATASAVEQIAELTRAGTDAEQLEPGGYYAYNLGDRVHEIDLTADRYLDQPRRKTGTVKVSTVDSFDAYWQKHHEAGVSDIYADRQALAVTAVLDAHGAEPDATGWGQHRVVLALKHSEAFKAWIDRDGRYQTQEAFAEFLDDQRADIEEPDAATMLEIAQTIQGTQKVDWQAGHRLADGQRRIGYVETNDTRAGTKGELQIPQQILVGVQIFDGDDVRHPLTARLRHRIEQGQLRLMYKLDRPADVVTRAFDGVIKEIDEATGAAVLRGTPA